MLAVSRGDVNNDAVFNILDVTYLINYKYKEPPWPPPFPNVLLGDANCDGDINILDIVLIINHFSKDGPRPPLCYKY